MAASMLIAVSTIAFTLLSVLLDMPVIVPLGVVTILFRPGYALLSA